MSPASTSSASMPSAAATASCVWVAANRADGPPHVTPVWFVQTDGVLWFTTSLGAHKVRLLEADPRVSLAIDESADGGGAVAEGRAELLDPSAEPEVIAAFAAKYHGWNAADAGPWGPRVLIRVPVDRWLLGP